MSKRKRPTVVILNPRDGRKYTSANSATDYVKREAAVWDPPGERKAIRFVDETPRAAFLLAAVIGSIEANCDEAVNTGIASTGAIKHIPVVGDEVKLFVKQTGGPRHTPRHLIRRKRTSAAAA